MNTEPLTRRQVLVGGVAGMTALMAEGGGARGGNAQGLPAAAAGMLRIGADLSVNRLGFGAMRVTGPGIWGEPKDPAECRRVLKRTLELGISFIDTADAYGPEVSERLIAESLYPYPPQLVIATKGGLTRPGPNSWVPDGRPEYLRAACEASLKRLRLERIDLYQFHAVDPSVPLEDSVGALAKLREQGKIRHVGMSNVRVEQLARARRIVPVVSVQNRYNVADRSSEEVLGVCQREGLAFIPWAPIARGSSGSLESGAGSEALEAAARAHGVSVFEVAIAWLLAKSPVMLPIPGTSSVAHLEDNVSAAALKLSAAELAALG
jgi:pyridoxine 4-dehydrogenase